MHEVGDQADHGQERSAKYEYLAIGLTESRRILVGWRQVQVKALWQFAIVIRGGILSR